MEAQALPLGILPDLWDAVPVKVSMQPGDVVLARADVVITVGYDPVEYDVALWNTDATRAIVLGLP